MTAPDVLHFILGITALIAVSLLAAGVAGHREDERVARASRRTAGESSNDRQ